MSYDGIEADTFMSQRCIGALCTKVHSGCVCGDLMGKASDFGSVPSIRLDLFASLCYHSLVMAQTLLWRDGG